ncbi:single-stranded DNA-binding protein, partial [Candidatus Peregrinibacteria bacterium CG_4_9_14_3_um_filter_49_12]
MYSLNRATVIGNLTREPETRQTPSGQNVCTFSVATNRTWASPDGKKQEATEFHNVVAWGKLADICAQYLNKGR